MAELDSYTRYTVVLGTYANPLGTHVITYNENLTIGTSGEVRINYNYGGVKPGAVGVYVNLGGASLTNDGLIIGGEGKGFSTAKIGQAGGAGLQVASMTTINNNGYIVGGTGGTGGYRQGTMLVGNGGIGGAGVDLSAAGATLTNSAGITGGGSSGSSNGTPGAGGIGVAVTAAVTVTNTNGAYIKGGQGGSNDFAGGNGGVGVDLSGGGTVNNAGKIIGGDGGNVNGYRTTNEPHYIAGNGGAGVNLAAGSTLTNVGVSASITGGQGGLELKYTGAVGGVGVNVEMRASLVNQAAITGGEGGSGSFGATGGNGGVGVALGTNATLTNFGTITGGAGHNANSGYIAGLGGVGVTVGMNASIIVEGKISGGANGIVYSQNVRSVTGAARFSEARNDFAHLPHARVSATPNATPSSAYADSILFGAGGSKMTLNAGASLIGDVGNFNKYDTITIANFTTGDHFDPETNTLVTAKDGNIQFANDTGVIFNLHANGDGTATLTDDAPCYRRGTRILTEHGEVAIERLSIGDGIVTMSGAIQRIRWIGQRKYSGLVVGDRDLLPIRFRAHSLESGSPARDLWVSPGHAMLVDGMLVPALAVVNGDSIRQEESATDLTYFHLEFDAHEVIIADGALAESYVDDETRLLFDNASEYFARYPHRVETTASQCVPRLEAGDTLETIRDRLATLSTSSYREVRRDFV